MYIFCISSLRVSAMESEGHKRMGPEYLGSRKRLDARCALLHQIKKICSKESVCVKVE